MKRQTGALAGFGGGRKRDGTDLQNGRFDAVLDDVVVLYLLFRRHVFRSGCVVIVAIDVFRKLGGGDRELGGLRRYAHGRTIVGSFRKKGANVGAFVRGIVPKNRIGVLVRMGTAVEPIVAAHYTDIAAYDGTQRIFPIIEPLKAAERLAVFTPFRRGVAICFVDPWFAFGQAAGKKFAEASDLCI